MKRELRRAHRVLILALVVLLPVLVLAALRARRGPPLMERVPAALAPAPDEAP